MQQLKKGQKLTAFYINGMAMTTQKQMIVDHERSDAIIFKNGPRKRKLMIINKSKCEMLFDGTDLPFSSDMQASNVWRGNACMNIVTELSHEEMKDWIENKALKPIEDDIKGRILIYTPEEARDSSDAQDYSNVLYPEIDVHCAPMDQYKSKNRPQHER